MKGSLATDVAIDLAAAVVYLVVANPALTGLAVHEWAGLGLILVLLVHCAVHYDRIIGILRRHIDKASLANLVLDAATLVTFIACTVSGLLVSRHVLPALGFAAPGYFFWSPMHALTAKALLALLLVHVIAHWRWVAALFTRKTRGKEVSDATDKEVPDATADR
jgi:hypothetical protein